MTNNPGILSAIEIWGWYGKGFDYGEPLALDIRLVDNKRLFLAFIRGEGLIPRGSAAVIKVLNLSPKPYENNIPRGSAARLLIDSKNFLYAPLHNNTRLDSPFGIWLIGDIAFFNVEHTYTASAGEHVSSGISKSLPIGLLAQELNLRLNTVEDVVINYDKIYEYVSLFPKKRPDSDNKEYKRIIFTDSDYKKRGYVTVQSIQCILRSEDPDYYMFEYFDGTDDEVTVRRIHTR